MFLTERAAMADETLFESGMMLLLKDDRMKFTETDNCKRRLRHFHARPKIQIW
jgi:hypothetical protein